jgi:iron complex transport system substrate-binding protein
MKKMALLILLLFLNSAASPAGASQEKGAVLEDDFGHPFPLGSPPQRIVSLAPNITEILFALGLADKIVGVTRYCDYPPQAVEKEKVGGLVDPNLEKIEALHPDLIIAFRGNPIGILNKLRRLRFPLFVLDIGKSLAALFLTIEKIGRLTGTEPAAARILESLEKEGRSIQDALKDVESRPRVFLALRGQGHWTAGRDSYLNDLLDKAGAINIAARMPQRWLNLNREQLIHENPEVIFILARDEPGFRDAARRLQTDSRLKSVRAIQDGRVHFLDENTASRFGPRLLDALREMAAILHPDKFEARK